jgi:iron complex outermembrane receptor protein
VNTTSTHPSKLIGVVLILIAGLGAVPSGTLMAQEAPAHSEAPVKMESVEVNDSAVQTPSLIAPVQITPATVEPVTTIDLAFIQNSIAPTVDFSEIMNYAPSVAVFPTGLPGSQETVTMSIRGFQDGQFNVTFDGIPFGDTNDFTHHSNDYFTAPMLGGVDVDRGPGSAHTIGEATFGGTVALTSRGLSDSPGAEISETAGNFNTWETELSFQTGTIAGLNGARAYFSLDHEENDGWSNLTGLRRTDYFFKVEMPVSKTTTVTAAITYSDSFYYTSAGATTAQIAQYGYRFGLNNDPTSQAYYAWNYQPKNTDMEYVKVQSQLGNVHVDNTAYSYAYTNVTRTGADLSGETPNGTVLGNAIYGAANNDVPGLIQPYNQYRAYGDIFRISDEFSAGLLEAGLWAEYQHNLRYGYNVDFTLGGAYDELPGTNTALNYYMTDLIRTQQPYVQFAWKPLPGLTVTPGVKFISFERSIEAPVNQKTGNLLDFSKTYSATMPSISVNEQASDNLSAYAQVAKGYLAPNLNLFYTNTPQNISVSPEQTVNYQAGVGYKIGSLSLTGDAYYIDFNNLIGKRTVGPNTYFFNEGGSTYEGIEAEASLGLGHGFSIYANGSLNHSKDKATGLELPEAPNSTAVLGARYDDGRFMASLVGKYIGSRYGDVGETIPMSGFTLATASVGYRFPIDWAKIKDVRLRFTVDNLFNKQGLADLSGYTPINNLPMYWTIVGRNYYLTATFDF